MPSMFGGRGARFRKKSSSAGSAPPSVSDSYPSSPVNHVGGGGGGGGGYIEAGRRFVMDTASWSAGGSYASSPSRADAPTANMSGMTSQSCGSLLEHTGGSEMMASSSGGGDGTSNPLAAFDACVEACDALAAGGTDNGGGGGMDGWSNTKTEGSARSASAAVHKGKEDANCTKVSDCSVLVSPDGTLLFVPSAGGDEEGGTTSAAVVDASVFFPGEDHASAVALGTDLRPDSDKSANGFSLGGYSSSAAGLALRRAERTLRRTGDCVEELVLWRKECALREASMCDRWNDSVLGPATSVDAVGNDNDYNGAAVNSANAAAAAAAAIAAGGQPSPYGRQRSEPVAQTRGSRLRSWSRGGAGRRSPPPPPASPSMPSPPQRPTGRAASEAGAGSSSSYFLPEVSPLDGGRFRTMSLDGIEANGTGGGGAPPPPLPLFSAPGSAANASATAGTAADGGGHRQPPNPHLLFGPLACPGTSLRSASEALEHYHSDAAEADARRWRSASSSSGGVLPDVRKSASDAARRLRNREAALFDLERRASLAERTLESRRAESAKLWDDVTRAEEEVQRLVEEKTRERSKQREKQRRSDQNKRQAMAAEGALDTGVTQAELWELVSRLGDEIGDGSSFSPIGLPAAPEAAPRDLSESGHSGDGRDLGGIDDSQDSEYSSSAAGILAPEGDQGSGPRQPQRPHVAGMARPPSPPLPVADREAIEDSLNLPLRHARAKAADDDVEDAAYALLNVLNALDLTRRSARVAAEGALLSAANSQLRTLKGLVRLEREGAEERLRRLKEVEASLDAVDVRSDLDAFVEREKRERPGASTNMGEDDDGGVASALAVLNSHGEQLDGSVGTVGGMAHFGGTRAAATGMSTFESWGDDDSDDDDDDDHSQISDADERLDLTRDEIEDVFALIFDDDDPHLLTPAEWAARNPEQPTHPCSDDQRSAAHDAFRSKIDLLCSSLSERRRRRHTNRSTGAVRVRRSNACYALNARRSVRTEVAGRARFDALCDAFDALLSGCDREEADVANAKMCMMLAVTFYMTEEEEDAARSTSEDDDDPSKDEKGNVAEAAEKKKSNGRDRRVYVKTKLLNHAIWSDEDFWVQALFQCVTESLTQSGVMANFDRRQPAVNGGSNNSGGGGGPHRHRHSSSSSHHHRRIKWYDLTPDERASAASQVHAVIFAQLSALAHSMVEFGCDVRRACAFVRTLSVRHQLPLGQRTALLQHLMRKCGEEEEEEKEKRGDENKDEGKKEAGDVVGSGGEASR